MVLYLKQWTFKVPALDMQLKTLTLFSLPLQSYDKISVLTPKDTWLINKFMKT